MITELLLSGLFGIGDILLGLLPDTIEWTVNTSVWAYLKDILDMICYLLPIDHIKNIIGGIIALAFFRISVALLRFLKGLIPFVG